jgi:hypothetical protein
VVFGSPTPLPPRIRASLHSRIAARAFDLARLGTAGRSRCALIAWKVLSWSPIAGDEGVSLERTLSHEHLEFLGEVGACAEAAMEHIGQLWPAYP